MNRHISNLTSTGWLIGAAFGLLASPALAASDPWITTKVKMAILTDSEASPMDVNVDTVDGVVTLHGKVGSNVEKTAAEKAARSVTDVKEVHNMLAVVPGNMKAVQVADDRLSKDIEAALQKDPGLQDKNNNIKVQSVNAGNVVLAGTASTMSAHLRAVETTRNVKGVKRVASEIESPDRLSDAEIWRDTKTAAKDTGTTVKSGAQDMWITSAAKVRLMANSNTPASSINVDTTNGNVTLFGMVPSAEAKREAEREVAKVDGVKRVNNELQVVAEKKQDVVAEKDDAIQDRVEKRIADNLRSDQSNVAVEVSNGVARLTGKVGSQSDRIHALTVTRATQGVRSVVDDLRIESGDAPSK